MTASARHLPRTATCDIAPAFLFATIVTGQFGATPDRRNLEWLSAWIYSRMLEAKKLGEPREHVRNLLLTLRQIPVTYRQRWER